MKLLLVDDEPLALSRLSRLLEELGETDTQQTTNAKEALDVLAKDPFDAVITDINMPGMNGLELAYHLRNIAPTLPIVFQTAYAEHALRSYEIGAVDYLLKPYDQENLQRALERIKDTLSKPSNTLRLMSKNHGEYYLLEPASIYYVQADLAEVIFRSSEGFSYYGGKISQMEALLEPYHFVKVHRSSLINVDKIEKIESCDQSKLRFYFKGINEYIESSKDGAKYFRQRFPKSYDGIVAPKE